MHLASGLPNIVSGRDPKESNWMAPTMRANEPLAGGSKSAIAVCAAIKCPRMPCGLVASWPGVVTSSIREELTWPACFGSISSDWESVAFLGIPTFTNSRTVTFYLVCCLSRHFVLYYKEDRQNDGGAVKGGQERVATSSHQGSQPFTPWRVRSSLVLSSVSLFP
jgi:hypothetical protein